MAENERDWSPFLKGFVIGGFLGALAGTLFAPKPGKELRADIKAKGDEVLQDAQEIYDEASKKAKGIIDEAKKRAEELKKEADRRLAEARQRAKEVLSRGEKKEEGTDESAKEIPGGREV
jgi:gas vesicle protein